MEASVILNTPLEIFQLKAPTDLTHDRKPHYPFLYEAVCTYSTRYSGNERKLIFPAVFLLNANCLFSLDCVDEVYLLLQQYVATEINRTIFHPFLLNAPHSELEILRFIS
jgi:hypothetical protein